MSKNLHRMKTCITFAIAKANKANAKAQMAELVDALVSNTSGVTSMPVRSRLWVLGNPHRQRLWGFFYFFRVYILPNEKAGINCYFKQPSDSKKSSKRFWSKPSHRIWIVPLRSIIKQVGRAWALYTMFIGLPSVRKSEMSMKSGYCWVFYYFPKFLKSASAYGGRMC